QALMPVAVVDRPPLRVREDLVGLGRLLELVLGGGVVCVDVGVQLAREHAKGLLDLLLGGVALYAEHLIGVARHVARSSSRHMRPRQSATAAAPPRARSRSRPRSPCAPARSPTRRRAFAGPCRSSSRRAPASAARAARSRGRCARTPRAQPARR